MKDWKGNDKTHFVTLGASNHTDHEREEHDFYMTDPHSLELFLDAFVKRDGNTLCNNIWECAAGNGALSEVLIKHRYNVVSSDLIDRGYGLGGIDFLKTDFKNVEMDILTNPPYSISQSFVEHAIDIVADKQKVIMFLKVQFLEGQKRLELFKSTPPTTYM